ncbi:hypothetical protein [Micromonospora sp. MA102]|uniref:hypothetical protein n=1 Tax=Micromonospora sp. MA102 TaxID=2952755 RepID=UPI0021C6027B|nr:hypothetical protein [Micromonospora sp. MA102]
MRRGVSRWAAAVLSGVMGSAALTAPALASENGTLACPPEYFYDITSSSSYHMPASGAYFKDGPGGSMSVSVTKSTTITATATVSAGATVSGIVAEAKIEVSASIAQSNTITVGHTFNHNITAGKYGNAQYGSWGYNVGWRYYYTSASCSTALKSSGTAKVPTSAEGWRYWETN